LNRDGRDGPSDAELMRRFGAGDDEAFRVLVERHERALLGYFWRRCMDRALAEDCVQEVFLRLVRHRGSWRPDAKFTTYLYRIAENHWIDRYRSRRSAPPGTSLDALAQDEGEQAGSAFAAQGPDPSQAAHARDLGERIRRAVLRLTPEQQQVFALGQTRGMRYEDVSQVLGIPVGTVKSRMHAAVLRLREILAEEGRDLVR
jgi:RNA polymerase sigma-70 factor (ECF subfamily)